MEKAETSSFKLLMTRRWKGLNCKKDRMQGTESSLALKCKAQDSHVQQKTVLEVAFFPVNDLGTTDSETPLSFKTLTPIARIEGPATAGQSENVFEPGFSGPVRSNQNNRFLLLQMRKNLHQREGIDNPELEPRDYQGIQSLDPGYEHRYCSCYF